MAKATLVFSDGRREECETVDVPKFLHSRVFRRQEKRKPFEKSYVPGFQGIKRMRAFA